MRNERLLPKAPVPMRAQEATRLLQFRERMRIAWPLHKAPVTTRAQEATRIDMEQVHLKLKEMEKWY